MKADFKSPEGKIYYKKRANLNEAHFGLLRNAPNFQNRTGIKNARKTKRNTHLNKKTNK